MTVTGSPDGMAAQSPRGLLPDYLRIPYAGAGNTVGLFGGSFNPPHPGHFMVAQTAMKRLGLDQVWWLVTPGNPLKDTGQLQSLESRVEQTRTLAQDPRMKVCALEVILGSPYTAKTVAALKAKRPDLNFVWIMGADNLASFHRWQNWRAIMESIPVVVVNRPGATLSPLSAPMSLTYNKARIDEHKAALLKRLPAPAWTFLHGPLDPSSSTALRQRGKKATD